MDYCNSSPDQDNDDGNDFESKQIDDNIIIEDGDYSSSDDEPLNDDVAEYNGNTLDLHSSLIGVTGKKWEELYSLYKKHSRVMGFSVRRSTTRRQGDAPEGNVIEKYFVCSSQGTLNSGKKSNSSHLAVEPTVEPTVDPTIGGKKKRKQRTVQVTRTGCNAAFRVKFLKDDGHWKVMKHIVAHNHPLTPTQWQHHHRSERAIPPEEGEMIKTMTEAMVPPAVQYRYLSATSGGDKFVGHSKKDHYNFVTRLKMKKIAAGDAQTLVDILSKSAAEDPSFFFRVQFDDKCRVRNIFWRDSMMKEDYLLYHDVLIFDTTYRTNRYNLICGALVGINNHWSNVMFGCAFISDEKQDSFEWLMKTFNESMGGDIVPTSIFTDQDKAMTNAIEEVYPTSIHRLCQWHIQQNAISHFGSMKYDKTFQGTFNKCLRGCFSDVEFEETWSKMVSDYGLADHPWFTRLYDLRYKWSTAFSKDFFSAGILSSQRSESTNHAIGFRASKTTSLTDFHAIFSDTVKRWRGEEERNEFQCSRSMPSSNLPMMGLLKHAANVYTLKLFQRFEQEFMVSLGTKVTTERDDYLSKVYRVFPEDSPNCPHFVSYDAASSFISCSCRKFEEVGILCFHSLRILHLHSVTNIPEAYISKRWTKHAKTEVWDRLKNQSRSSNTTHEFTNWRQQMLMNFHNLITKCNDVKEAMAAVERSYSSALTEVDSIIGRSIVSQTTGSGFSESPAIILDPARSTTKGRSARIKRQTKRPKSKKHDSTTTEETTIIPFTPTPRLI